MQSNFDACLKVILASEGGYTVDSGGPTEMGITEKTLSAWLGRTATPADVKALTPATVSAIYRGDYWNLIRGDALPAGIDLMAFDEAVNQGPGRAIRTLQSALSVAVDGALGPLTMAALATCNAPLVIDRIVILRTTLYHSDATWPVDGKGWMARLYRTAGIAHGMVEKTDSVAGVSLWLYDDDGVPIGPLETVKAPPTIVSITSPGIASATASVAPAPQIPWAAPGKPSAIVTQAPPIAAATTAVGTGALGIVHAATTSVNFSAFIDRIEPFLLVGIVLPAVVWLVGRGLQAMHINTQSAAASFVIRAVENGVSALAAQGVTYADAHASVDVHDRLVAQVINYAQTAVPQRLAASGITPDQLANLVSNRLAQIAPAAS